MVTVPFNFENVLPNWLLNINGTVTMQEVADTPVPGHFTGTAQFTQHPTPSSQAPAGIGTPGVLAQFNIQRDQQLQLVTNWTQNGFLTNFNLANGQFTVQYLFEQLGPAEAGAAGNQVANVNYVTGPGQNYNNIITMGAPNTVFPLGEGLYKVYARFAFAPTPLPNTPIAALAEIALLNVYTM